jgi:hypothetical protein
LHPATVATAAELESLLSGGFAGWADYRVGGSAWAGPLGNAGRHARCYYPQRRLAERKAAAMRVSVSPIAALMMSLIAMAR